MKLPHRYGHSVSDYVVKNLVERLAATDLGADGLCEGGPGFAAVIDAFRATNAALAGAPGLDSSTSGTTCVLALVEPTFIFTANVGDSRCVAYGVGP